MALQYTLIPVGFCLDVLEHIGHFQRRFAVFCEDGQRAVDDGCAEYEARGRGGSVSDCQTCDDGGWICAATGEPADFEHGSCCEPGMSEYGPLGPGCPSADGCPDCDRAFGEEWVMRDAA